jgi:lysozyme
MDRDKALSRVDRNIRVPLTEPQKVGVASFCPYNIGPVNVCHRPSISASTQVTASVYAKHSAGGLNTVAVIAV